MLMAIRKESRSSTASGSAISACQPVRKAIARNASVGISAKANNEAAPLGKTLYAITLRVKVSGRCSLGRTERRKMIPTLSREAKAK